MKTTIHISLRYMINYGTGFFSCKIHSQVEKGIFSSQKNEICHVNPRFPTTLVVCDLRLTCKITMPESLEVFDAAALSPAAA